MQARLNNSHELRTGVSGAIRSIPAGHTFESILHVGTGGINAAYRAWGDVVLASHGKERTAPNASVVMSHLGFSTTGDYFYSPEGATGVWPNAKPGKNFEETILDIHAYAVAEKLPYRSILLDSWWYGEYQHNGSGMLSWDESSAKSVDELDPGGRFPHGLKWLHKQLGGSNGMVLCSVLNLELCSKI
jgi:hypothetical protein